MAANPLAQAHRRAKASTTELGLLYARALGSRAHPRGRMLSAYRAARAAVGSTLRGGGGLDEISPILLGLGLQIDSIARAAIGASSGLGARLAQGMLADYHAAGVNYWEAAQEPDIDPLAAMALGPYEAQLAAIRGLLGAGVTDPEEIIGDQERLGILQPGPVITAAARAVTTGLAAGMEAWVGQETLAGQEYGKQAVAGLDERTTDCCLRVHGQIQPWSRRFNLTGTPRYARRLAWVPFHDFCRTSVALYLEAYDDGLTNQMRQAAQAELDARAEAAERAAHIKEMLAARGEAPDGRARATDTRRITRLRQELRERQKRARVEIHPAHARSRRG